MPQEVREPRYCAHLVMGVEMLLSISQWPPLTYIQPISLSNLPKLPIEAALTLW